VKDLSKLIGYISLSREAVLSLHLSARFINQSRMVSRRSKATSLSLLNVAGESELRVTSADHSLV
jgi:hypothetical protein